MAYRQGRDIGPRQERTHSALEQFNAASPGERRISAWHLQLVPKDSDLVLVKQAQDQFLMQEP